MGRKIVLACAWVTISALLCGTPTAWAKPTAAAQAKMICGECHDTSSAKNLAQGSAGAPPPFGLIAQDPKMTPEKLRIFLQLPHGAMDNILLSGKELDTLIDYIQSLKSTAPPPVGR